jgi:epoxyqueuosine reductase
MRKPDPRTLTRLIKAEALRQGFELVGVTRPETPPHLDVYTEWLAAGYHGEMGYLATERARTRRAEPHQILPECRSILVLGVRYSDPKSVGRVQRGPAHGRIASYAWASDYHEILPDRLQKIVEYLEVRAGHPIPNRWYTDTGPILEREFSQRAGLGWIGKNTCLINPQHGSYFLLAEILLGIDLEPDAPHAADYCGSCTRCLDACPTACILPDRTLDAQRCISYLTIELKGPIPVELRPEMDNWVFGCDICQEVCPWNDRFARPTGDPDFEQRPGVPLPDLRAELHLSPTDFNRKFKGSPIKRAKRRGYLRNVAIALGNSGEPAAIDDLIMALKDEPEPLVRGHAAWAIGEIGGEGAHQALQKAEKIELDPYVLEEITSAQKRVQPSRTD